MLTVTRITQAKFCASAYHKPITGIANVFATKLIEHILKTHHENHSSITSVHQAKRKQYVFSQNYKISHFTHRSREKAANLISVHVCEKSAQSFVVNKTLLDNRNKNTVSTHGSVSCSPRNPGSATDKCVFYRSKENAIFTHL